MLDTQTLHIREPVPQANSPPTPAGLVSQGGIKLAGSHPGYSALARDALGGFPSCASCATVLRDRWNPQLWMRRVPFLQQRSREVLGLEGSL